MSTFTKNKSFNRRALTSLAVESPRTTSINSAVGSAFASPRTPNFGGIPPVNRLSEISYLFQVLIVTGSIVSFLIIVAGGYLYIVPSLGQTFLGYNEPHFNSTVEYCDIFDGHWVVDDTYPLYNASECPFVEKGFDCLGNRREDDEYLKWRWKPNHCNVPRFNVGGILERLRGKRIVFVGDSMSRTQWESLICMLMTGLEDKTSVYEVNGNNITKRIRFLGVRFSSFNFTIEFFRSVFLVQQGKLPRHAPKRVKSTLKLDKLDDISHEWVSADVLIFNTGQWWVPGKLFETGCYFQVGNSVKLGMSIRAAFRLALDTWASWVENTIDTSRTRVLFRTFEPSHWGDHRSCSVTKHPTTDTEGREQSLFSETIMEVVKNMTVPVTVLHVTSMSAFRSDAHVGLWSDNPSVPDCSHWCLPGVPDIWNEILLFYLSRQA
ncbi:PREDICTED: protein trichome berefringence-like 7 [Tarenaya hassleriana]|uniref:protein trichome berefringence-like 7 n=1 Tax=Tarenaya hassleriana TaxID=28532 RepID=UPI00053C2B78|nr:PREDICTED: protein trichome berefringence-like 7 [Tarenaya hassleriana]XP_010551170.1 PREDICTED: protein trichome berefringence-like 7 [Tarenaya hassleriana]XP_010551171.1 PREDICTED: protein trichome berefringence-like 7 [Tarenaya hassleriana]